MKPATKQAMPASALGKMQVRLSLSEDFLGSFFSYKMEENWVSGNKMVIFFKRILPEENENDDQYWITGRHQDCQLNYITVDKSNAG